MLILAVTHPDTISRNPRSLSEGGRQQGLLAARRLRELIGKQVFLGAIVSSPKARCLETAILVAREFGETTKADGTYDGRVHVVGELEETPGQVKDISALNEALGPFRQGDFESPDKAILLAVHGDLANMLNGSAIFTQEAASEGWFVRRPVIAGFDYTPGRVTVRFCEELQRGSWVSCLE